MAALQLISLDAQMLNHAPHFTDALLVGQEKRDRARGLSPQDPADEPVLQVLGKLAVPGFRGPWVIGQVARELGKQYGSTYPSRISDSLAP